MAPYDAPWFAQRVIEVLDSLEIKEAALVGNSMGGRVSLEVACMEPARVKAMVLMMVERSGRLRFADACTTRSIRRPPARIRSQSLTAHFAGWL